MLKCSEFTSLILTHLATPKGPIPTAQDPDGVYPYQSFSHTSDRPVLKPYRMLKLENSRIRAIVCPDLGGKLLRLELLPSGKNTLLDPGVVRPVRILPRQHFIGGGIELSFPISHTPSLNEPVLHKLEQKAGRAYAWCGERELRFGMHWCVEWSLGEEDAFLTQRSLFFNPGTRSHKWMSWSNAGVPARPDTEFHFPSGPVLSHGQAMRSIDWDSQGPRRQSDIARMTGFFWRGPDVHAFGAFTPSLGCGLYHLADGSQVPGIKLWSDGMEQGAWVEQYLLAKDPSCLEIQAGPLADQSLKDLLQPGASRAHTEFWFPTEKPLDIRKMALPSPALLPEAGMPRFGWARPGDSGLWLELMEAARAGAAPPAAPGEDDNRWAPSGMDGLGEALSWAEARGGEDAQRWRFQRGAWLAGRDEVEEALKALEGCTEGRALALAGRLHRRCKKDPAAGADRFRKLKEPLRRHPEVVVEADLCLARLGPAALKEREAWLDSVGALKDESLLERRAAWLCDSGRFEEAKKLLEGTPFQRVHQRYARKKLWLRICDALGLPKDKTCDWLGEDDLAEFGAYREYEEDLNS